MLFKCVYLVAVYTKILVTGNAQDVDLLGTNLYTLSDVHGRVWTDTEEVELLCRISVGSLVPTKVPQNGDDFIKYFVLMKNNIDKIASTAGRKRAMIMVADAIGSYLYAKMLPVVRALYYDGKSGYSTTKRLHDLMKKIKYVLDTDGRGWAKPRPAEATSMLLPSMAVTSPEGPAANRCGGVDAGPYGLLHRRRLRRRRVAVDDGTGVDVPFFDNDTRPRSLVLPWRPGQPVLLGVWNENCYRALFDYCSRTAVGSKPSHTYALRKWLNATVLSLVTPESDRWYPVLWGATLAAQQLDRAIANNTSDDYSEELPEADEPAAPNGNFYATIILASSLASWTTALCITLYNRCLVYSRTRTID